MSQVASVAVTLAGIGIAGEAVFLRHGLVSSKPFKGLTYPPSSFYELLGNLGVPLAALVVFLLARLLSKRGPLLVPALATTALPLLCLGLVVAATHIGYGWTVPAHVRNYDDYQIGAATEEFALAARELALVGLAVGSLCGGVLWVVRRKTSALRAA